MIEMNRSTKETSISLVMELDGRVVMEHGRFSRKT